MTDWRYSFYRPKPSIDKLKKLAASLEVKGLDSVSSSKIVCMCTVSETQISPSFYFIVAFSVLNNILLPLHMYSVK